MLHLLESPRLLLARLTRRPLAACAALVLPLTLTGGAVAAQSAFNSPSAGQPKLTANTPASCNRPQQKGYARCFAVVRTPSDHQVTPDASGPPSTALGPSDIQSAYKLPSATAGGGQTVAIVDSGGYPTAEQDLATFRSQYGLPPCTTANGCLKIVNQDGQASPLPPVDPGWPTEESLDLDAVSSACPNCNILLVQANSARFTDLGASVDEAVKLGATAISNSYGGDEGSYELQADSDYNHPGVAVTASSGDSGYGVIYPSASQYVTAVGGTTLTKDTSVARGWDESVWGSSSGGEGTGSGCSLVEPQPGFQLGISQLGGVCSNRATADVSADADPASGLAIYDTTDEGGWLQVGGTSLASPLVAAIYALAGTPVSGSYPNAYPYHDNTQSADLFDVTSGANGSCGNVLCTAGNGWDGPTGLGTPDGIKAFQGAPQGQLTGQVTDQATGKPISGVAVTAQPGDYVTRTDASGNYNLTLATGTYTLTATDFGYQDGTQSGVQVTAGQAVTENIVLTPQPSGTLAGTVTDGSGHGWPLHASITIPGDPNSPVWTSPYTGKYSITVPQGSYTLTVSAGYPGYQDKQVQVTVNGDTAQDVTLDADLSACTAPGYGPDGLSQDFSGWTGGTAQDGWAVTGRGQGWRFDDPGNVSPPPHSLPTYPPGSSQHYAASFDDDHFAVAGTQAAGPGAVDTTLTSPPVDLSGQSKPEISFDSAYYPAGRGESAAVQLSTDSGRSWATVWHQDINDALGPVSIPIPQAAGKTGVQARWAFTGAGSGYWALAGVHVGAPGCAAEKGGLVAGTVTDKSTGNPVNGAQVAVKAGPPPYPWPEGISLATGDPALAGGFYWLFTPAGSQQLSVAAAGYTNASATVNVAADQVSHQDWALTAAGGS